MIRVEYTRSNQLMPCGADNFSYSRLSNFNLVIDHETYIVCTGKQTEVCIPEYQHDLALLYISLCLPVDLKIEYYYR